MTCTGRPTATRPTDRRANPYSVWARPFCNKSPPELRPALWLLRDPEHRHGDYRRTEPRLGAVACLIRIAGMALADLIGSLLRLRTKSREDIRRVTQAPQSEGLHRRTGKARVSQLISIFTFRRDRFRSRRRPDVLEVTMTKASIHGFARSGPFSRKTVSWRTRGILVAGHQVIPLKRTPLSTASRLTTP